MLGGDQSPAATVYLDPDLLAAIEEIAVRNGRPISHVINEMLSHALYAHQLTEGSLQTWRQLTKREQEITALIWLGLTNPQIAQRLKISPNTVKTHIKNILKKFDVHSKKNLSDLLSGLDLSDWIDLGADAQLSPTPSDSPDQAHP